MYSSIFRLYNTMTLSAETINQDINTVWRHFEGVLTVANGLINYAPVFRDYYYEALDSFKKDNVQYIEVRALLPGVRLSNCFIVHAWLCHDSI